VTKNIQNFMVQFFGVALLSLPLAFPALAQSRCDRPHDPLIPSGSSASAGTMERSLDEVQDYVDDMNDYLRCVDGKDIDARAELEAIISEWQWAVDDFNDQ